MTSPPMSDDLAEAATETWYAVECGFQPCWCKMICTSPDPELDTMEGCIIAAGCVSAKNADLIVAAVNAYRKSLTAPTPVTVEGLKERGFKHIKGAPAGWFSTGLLEALCDGEEITWRVTEEASSSLHGLPIPRCIAPRTMQDVDALLSRLSRPKPQ